MDEHQNKKPMLPNAHPVPVISKGNDLPETRHQVAGRRQPRTRFSSLQRYELERVFNQFNYLTTQSWQMLQNLGIPKRTILVWFKNRRIKRRKAMLNTKSWSRKHPDTRPFPSQPNIYANQSSSLLPTAHAHAREVQNTCMDGPFESSNETWPYSSTVAFGTRDRSGAENCSSDVNQWYYPETSSVPKAIHHSESSAENTSLLDNSSAMTHSYTKRSANSSVPWKFTYPNMTGTMPFIDDGDQRVPTCNEYLGCSKRLEQRAVPIRKGSTEYTSPPDSSTAMPHSKVSASSSFPWKVTHDHPNMTETLPFIHQSDNRIGFRNGDSGPSKLLDQRAVPYFTAPQPPKAELSRPQMSPQDLEFTSLLDDLMAVLNEDLLATQNNTTVPPFLPSLPHSDTFHSQAVNDELLNAITSMPSDQQLNMAGVSNINNHMHDHL